MTQRTELAPPPPAEDLIISRLFNAPREIVFKAWTDPAMVARWWGPKDFTSSRCEVDARPGGAIRIDMRAPDGTIYPMGGEFREIAPPERIVFVSVALDDEGGPMIEALNTVTFDEYGLSGTLMTLAVRVLGATPEAAPHLAGMEEGWTQSLVRLQDFVASLDGADGASVATGEPAGRSDR
jgi:uncharacterized protein YndB with AHSA1/START domain